MKDTPNSPSRPAFVQQQRARILRRLERYNKISTVKEQLEQTGDLAPYQHYKINTLSRYLPDATTTTLCLSCSIRRKCPK